MSTALATVVVAILSLAGCILASPPFLLQFRTRNKAVLTLVGSVWLLNFMRFINAMIWHAKDMGTWWKGQGLCDVEVKLMVGIEMTISGSLACLFRQLNFILDPKQYTQRPSKAQTRATIIFESTLLVIFPILRMALSYLVQPDRYWIYGAIGCTPSFVKSWPSYMLVLAWPLAVCVVGAVYALFATYKGFKHYREVSKLLCSDQTKGNKSRIVRMFILAMVLWFIITPFQTYSLWDRQILHAVPFSWSRIHPSNWSKKVIKLALPLSELVFPVASSLWSVVIFGTLGWGHDAVTVYRVWWDHLKYLVSRKDSARPLNTHSTHLSSTSDANARHTRDFVLALDREDGFQGA